MIKVQDNATPYTGWDTWWCYFYNGASFSLISNGAIAPNTIRARVRLQVIEQVGNVRVQVSIDTDLDGLWNIANDTVTTQGLGTSGRIGINGYQSALADDLKYFSGTLYLNGMPRIGTSVDLKGNGTPALGYQGACSLGHAGFSIGGLRAVPLDLDGLLILSMVAPGTFVNFAGVTDGGGDFTMSLAIPASPALVGNTIWSSAITFAPGSGVQEIMPDVQITFLP
jgi:hypothetical protein